MQPGSWPASPRRSRRRRTYGRNLPIVPVRAQGMVIEGADGREYLDCLAGAGSLALGHNHPATIEAIQALLLRGAPLQVLDIATPEPATSSSPPCSTRCRRSWPGRSHPLLRPGGHRCRGSGAQAHPVGHRPPGPAGLHGRLPRHDGGALGATGNVAAREHAGHGGAEVTRLPFPYPYRCPFGLGGRRTATVAAAYVERLLDDANGGVTPPRR